jgi:hypothetical protein
MGDFPRQWVYALCSDSVGFATQWSTTQRPAPRVNCLRIRSEAEETTVTYGNSEQEQAKLEFESQSVPPSKEIASSVPIYSRSTSTKAEVKVSPLVIQDMKLSRRLNAIKSSPATLCVLWSRSQGFGDFI